MNQMPRYVLDISCEELPEVLESTGKLRFIDTTGDGVPDAILDPPSSSYVPVDTNGDGRFDSLAYDTTGDDFANEVLSLPEGWQFVAGGEGDGLVMYNSSLNVTREYRSLSVDHLLRASDPLRLQQLFAGEGSSSSSAAAVPAAAAAEAAPKAAPPAGRAARVEPSDDEATWRPHEDTPQTDDEGHFEVNQRKYLDARANSSPSLWHAPVPRAVEWADDGDTIDGDDDSAFGQTPSVDSGSKKRRSLLIAYFPRCADEALLCGVLSKFGVVSLCRIIRDGRGVSKCFGFVTFAEAEAAEKAMQECEKGRVIVTDPCAKKWHLKANWSNRACGKMRRSGRHAGPGGRSRSGTGSA